MGKGEFCGEIREFRAACRARSKPDHSHRLGRHFGKRAYMSLLTR